MQIRRHFLKAIGLGGLLPLSLTDHTKDISWLVGDVEKKLLDDLKQYGVPFGVFVHSCAVYEGRDVLRVVWHLTTHNHRQQLIDLGELGRDPFDWNGHFRQCFRVADALSEKLGCICGWSYSCKFDGTPEGRQNMVSTDLVSVPSL
jgi:hypothetical protein